MSDINTHTCARQNALGGGACPERRPAASCPGFPHCRWASDGRAQEWKGSPGADESAETFDGLKDEEGDGRYNINIT